MLGALIGFQKNLVNWTKYSKVTWGLYFKILRFCLSGCSKEVAKPFLAPLRDEYAPVLATLVETATNEFDTHGKISFETQAYLKAIGKLQLVVLVQLKEAAKI